MPLPKPVQQFFYAMAFMQLAALGWAMLTYRDGLAFVAAAFLLIGLLLEFAMLGYERKEPFPVHPVPTSEGRQDRQG